MNVLTIGGAMVDTIVTIASDKIEQIKMRNAESWFLASGRRTEDGSGRNRIKLRRRRSERGGYGVATRTH